MSEKSWLLAGALFLGLVGSVAAHLGFRARAHVDGGPTPAASLARAEVVKARAETDVDGLRAEVARLQGQMLALRAQVAEQKAPEAVPPAPEPEALDPETLDERKRASARRWKEHMAEVAASFEQEPRDRNFSTTTAGAVDRAIQNNPVIQKVAGNVDCRSRTCRVEIHDGKGSEVSKQLPVFLHSLGPTLHRAQADNVEGPNGQTTTVLYLTNEEPAVPLPGQ